MVQTTRLSTKGQVIIPKEIREIHNWRAGIKFYIIDHDEGILLKPRQQKNRVRIDDLIGCADYKGKRKALQDMERGIIKGALEHI